MIEKFLGFAAVVADLLVFGFAMTAYEKTHRRSVLFIGIACALWAAFELGNVVLSDNPSWFRWTAYNIGLGSSYVLWVVGCGLLFRDYSQVLRPGGGEQDVSPNGGPAKSLGDSGVGEGPPSVS